MSGPVTPTAVKPLRELLEFCQREASDAKLAAAVWQESPWIARQHQERYELFASLSASLAQDQRRRAQMRALIEEWEKRYRRWRENDIIAADTIAEAADELEALLTDEAGS